MNDSSFGYNKQPVEIHDLSKKFGKKTEWVVTFNNKKGLKGKKLFIFLKLNGDFVAANFTGK